MENAVATPYTAIKIDIEDGQSLYQQALAIRKTVFIVEQGLKVEENWEQVDPGFTHFGVLADPGEEIIGSARLGEVAQGCQTRPVAKIEWIGILPGHRNQGAGRILMETILGYIKTNGYPSAYLQANISAIRFYEKFGFETEGFAFEEGGLTYYAMRCII